MRRRGAGLARAIIFGLGLVCPGSGAVAQSETTTRFEIASQPLARALDAYSKLSGLEVAYDGTLAAGRWSHSVQGVLEPDEALRELLIDTGLSARVTGSNSFMVTPMSQSVAASSGEQAYFSVVQRNITRVLCWLPEAQPGTTDVILQFWVDASGVIVRAELLDAPRPEASSVEKLRGVSIGEPPRGLPQPITMAVLARSGYRPAGCPSTSTAVVR